MAAILLCLLFCHYDYKWTYCTTPCVKKQDALYSCS